MTRGGDSLRQPLNEDQPLLQQRLPFPPRVLHVGAPNVETRGLQHIRLRPKRHKGRYKRGKGQCVIGTQRGQRVIGCLLHRFIARTEGWKSDGVNITVIVNQKNRENHLARVATANKIHDLRV